MRVKILIPNADGSPGGNFAFQEVQDAPKAGDILVFESGSARLLEYAAPATDDADGADFLCRASLATVNLIHGRNVSL